MKGVQCAGLEEAKPGMTVKIGIVRGNMAAYTNIKLRGYD